MLFCCFQSTKAAEGSQDAVPAKLSEVQRDGTALGNGATGATMPSQALVQSIENAAGGTGEGPQPTTTGSLQQGKSQHVSQDAVMRVVALLQELLGLTSERMQPSRIMALLCQRLSVSWACLTALSADGEVFQHIGSAYYVENKTGMCSFSSCRTNSGLPQGPGPGRGPPSRTSSTNSIAGASAMEAGMSDPHRLRGSGTSIEAAASSNQPVMLSDPGSTSAAAATAASMAPVSGGITATTTAAPLASSAAAAHASGLLSGGHQQQQQRSQPYSSSSGAGADVPQPAPHVQPHPPQHPQQQQPAQHPPQSYDDRTTGEVPVSSWPIDWQLMYRERGMRAFACLPVTATNGSGTVIGCLSLGSAEPLDWSRQFWASSTRLITGWAAGAITTTRATARATFFSRVFGATNLDGLARAFAYDMPVFLADGAAGPGTALPEVRLALVSSRLQHAVVYAAPLLQVSGRLGIRPMGHLGLGGGGGNVAHGNGALGGGGGGPFTAFNGSGPSGSGASMAGLVIGSVNSIGTDRGLLLGGGLGLASTAHPAAAAAMIAARTGGTATGYETMDCMVLGSTLDVEEQMSSSSNSNGGGGSSARRDGGKVPSTPLDAHVGAGKAAAAAVQEAPPVDCVKISTDSTLLMSVLEAGDIMIIKDALQYFGGGRMVARDLALNNTRPATAGTLVILPLVHRCRSLGCVYVFARNEFNLTFSRAAWGDLASMMSRAVFGQLVGKLRHEWYSVLSEDPESHASQFHNARSAAAGVGGARGRVRRTTTGNSLCSNASSLRPSFELLSKSVEQATGTGGGGGNKDAAAALAAAAAVLEYAGFMLPDGDDGLATAALTVPTATTSRSPGATTASSSPRHRVPSEHAGLSNQGGGGSGTGSSEPPITTTPAEFAADAADAAPAAAGPTTAISAPTPKPGGSDPPSTSPSSLSFRLPPELQDRLGLEGAKPEAGVEGSAVRGGGSRPVSQTGLVGAQPEEGKPPEPAMEALGPAPLTPMSPRLPCGGLGAELAAAATAAIGTVADGSGGGVGGIAAAASAAEQLAGIAEAADMEAEDGEEISGSSRELQGWPELVDILFDMHRTRNVSVYLAAYRGQAVAVKMMRSHMSMDGRPGHLDTEALTIAAQQQLSTVRHPNVLRVLMVYPLVYEVVAGKTQRSNNSFIANGGGGTAANATTTTHSPMQQHSQHQQQLHHQQQQLLLLQQQQHPQQQYGLGLGLGPLDVMVHAMNDMLSGASAADASGGWVYLTAVLPRREKFKRGLALMLELFPSLSLREVLQKRMLVAQPDTAAAGGGGGLTVAEQLGAGSSYACISSQNTLSDIGNPGTPSATGPISSSGGGGAAGGGGGHLPPYLPSLPEVTSGNDPVFNVDSSPGLALTGASNSGGANVGAFGSGPGGGMQGGSQAPPMPVLLAILTQVAAGMMALHSAGLAHGELRPENVLLALPHHGGSSLLATSGQDDRTAAATVDGVTANITPRTSPTPQRTASGSGCNGAGFGVGGGGGGSGGSSRGRSTGGWVSGFSGGGGGGGDPERLSRPERPHPGRPITTEVIVKIKDAGMTVVGFSKGSQTVRKLLQRNRSAILPYLPPEVHRGERFGRSADVYMFGILMWELYTGSVAFSNLAGTPIKLLQTIIADGVRPPWPEGTPVWYQSLASRCWSGNPKQRPSFRRIGDKLMEANASAAVAANTTAAAAAAGWGVGGGALQGVAEGL